jgi:hypothetical protein
VITHRLTILALLVTASLVIVEKAAATYALAVAPNGIWAVVHRHYGDYWAVCKEALELCKANGGVDAKLVASGFVSDNYPGAIAVSDGGKGRIIGWSLGVKFPHGTPWRRLAKEAAIRDCVQKGGSNPVIVKSWGAHGLFEYIQKYQASVRQAQAAGENGAAVVKEYKESNRKLPKYVAVSTSRDHRSKGNTSVMIFDTVTQQVVGTSVYDLSATPKNNEQLEIDELTVPYASLELQVIKN